MVKKTLNKNLGQAKNAKEDEFYTQLSDIERELGHYKEHFKDKVIFCNCDDPEESNFFQYFCLNFEFLGLKKLIATHFEREKPSYKLEIVKDLNKDGKIDCLDTTQTKLKQNGDFRSPECIEILKEADIVVTNPPFSLFREYVAQLIEYDKKFLIIGNVNAVSYKEIFKLIKNNKIWLGYNCVRHFKRPDGTMYETARTFWYTNLDIGKRHENLILYKKYYGNEEEYPKYDNYDAINVDKAIHIPCDYKEVMGVPITFMDKYNPKQFEILGNEYDLNIEKGRGYINGKRMYSRVFIKNKKL